MTLSEFIESLDTEMVKIGAENGSGFFFIGPVKRTPWRRNAEVRGSHATV